MRYRSVSSASRAKPTQFDIEAIRELLLIETGTIPSDEEAELEEPSFGSTKVAIRASKIILPDNKTITPHGKRIVLDQPSRGRIALDGSGVQVARYDELEAAVLPPPANTCRRTALV